MFANLLGLSDVRYGGAASGTRKLLALAEQTPSSYGFKTPTNINIMPARKGTAVWDGTLKEGSGSMQLGSGAYQGPYSFKSRFEEGTGTNPEELIAAALAGCFSMALSANLEKAGHPAKHVNTVANARLEMVNGTPTLTTIELQNEATVPGIDEAAFQEQAQKTKAGCPVSRALTGTEITLTAKLV